MNDLVQLSIVELMDFLAKGEISSVELTNCYLDAIEKASHLNAYVLVTPDLALDMARASDARRAKGEVGNLEGIPIGVKELFCTKGVRTTGCSNMLSNFVPTYESTVTANLWRDGAVMLGKLNCDELAMGSSNENSFFGPVINPWRGKKNIDLVAGGSSGGSSAAVTAGLCAGATGSDSGGSIRQPAAFCGVIGIKPTYGSCSRWGLLAFASSLDQAGPLAKSVRDGAILLNSFVSLDHKDPTSVDTGVDDYGKLIGSSLKGQVIGVPKEYHVEGMSSEIEKVWSQGVSWLQDAGASIREISLPNAKYALPAYCIISSVEASSNLSCYDGIRYGISVAGKDIEDTYELTRATGFGTEVRRRLMVGTYLLSSDCYEGYFTRAQRVRTLITRDFKKVFKEGVDAILTPTTPTEAFAVGAKTSDPVEMYLNDLLTTPVNLAGLPAMSVPAAISKNNLPLALQVIGRPFDEPNILNIAAIIEKAAGRFVTPNFTTRSSNDFAKTNLQQQ